MYNVEYRNAADDAISICFIYVLLYSIGTPSWCRAAIANSAWKQLVRLVALHLAHVRAYACTG